MTLQDTVGALCTVNPATARGRAGGPLSGLTFVAKDLFDVAGAPTGFGHPEWLRTHPVPAQSAPVVQALLDAGADLVGKSHCDELCYSLTGENVHYGTPVNTAAPGRVPGGSSNGSAAAVAAGLCDIGLGSDCGGSIRIPASYCGLWGWRPTWGRVPIEGAAPFAASFDVAGLLTRDAATLEKAALAVLPSLATPKPAAPKRLVIATDAFGMVEPRVADALTSAVGRVSAHFAGTSETVVSPEGLTAWFEIFRTIQAAEIWESLGGWIREVKPHFGPGIKERLEWASQVSIEARRAAEARRREICRHLDTLLAPGDVLCLPTSPRAAPLIGTPTDTVEIEYRHQALCLLCISGLTGRPQISMPLATIDGLPLGLSLLGPMDSDEDLLRLTTAIAASQPPR